MSKVGYTDQNRLDPQWAPSDAEMINWIESTGYHMERGRTLIDDTGWRVTRVIHAMSDIGNGPTWRAAVEDAMRKENRDI